MSSKLGLGCMSLSHAYGAPTDPAQAKRLIRYAYERGVRHFDTAILYGFGKNESLVGEAIKPFRHDITLASKCGLTTPGPDMKRAIDGRPASIKRACDDSLRRLRTDVIDLYYLHRLDNQVPIEDSMGALKDLLEAGKIKGIGLSEVSAATIRRAHSVHPLSAVQNEYSLWSRNPEIAGLETCRELDIVFVAFSPLARGFLCGGLGEEPNFMEGDIRAAMPRFKAPHYTANLKLLTSFGRIAQRVNCSNSQLALAWLLHKGEHILPIPGTTRAEHLDDNLGAVTIELDAELIGALNSLFAPSAISGNRYPAKTQLEIDTEQFEFELPN